MERRGREPLGEHVRELLGRRDMQHAQLPESHLLTDEMYVELDVFRATMMNGVGGEVDRRDIVTVDNCGLLDIKKQLLEKPAKPRALGEVAMATARYSASALERDTVGCRLDDHNMSEGPR